MPLYALNHAIHIYSLSEIRLCLYYHLFEIAGFANPLAGISAGMFFQENFFFLPYHQLCALQSDGVLQIYGFLQASFFLFLA